MTAQPEKARTVYVVDDEPAVRDALRLSINAMGFVSRSFSSGSDFLAHIAEEGVDPNGCLIADLQMPNIGGFELVKRLNKLQERFPAILISGHGAHGFGSEAEGLGAQFLAKPFRTADLQRMILAVLDD